MCQCCCNSNCTLPDVLHRQHTCVSVLQLLQQDHLGMYYQDHTYRARVYADNLCCFRFMHAKRLLETAGSEHAIMQLSPQSRILTHVSACRSAVTIFREESAIGRSLAAAGKMSADCSC